MTWQQGKLTVAGDQMTIPPLCDPTILVGPATTPDAPLTPAPNDLNTPPRLQATARPPHYRFCPRQAIYEITLGPLAKQWQSCEYSDIRVGVTVISGVVCWSIYIRRLLEVVI